ncbi:MAG: CARDB domain-containing protein, partial [Prevotella sp.]
MSLIALVLMTIAGGLTTETRADNRLYIEPVVGKVGGTVNIPVYLDNSDDIVAAQFDVTLPFNIPADGVVTMTNRSNGHAVSSSVSGKTITVMLTSMENKKLKGNSGILLRIPMNPYDDGNTAKPYPIKISNIVLANNAGKNVATETSSESTFTVSTEDLPDLIVEKISVSPDMTSVTPGEKATFNYTVRNQGDGATKAGWTAKLYMENEATGVRTYIGTQSNGETLAGGASKAMTFTTILPSAMHIDGECKTYVEITPASGCGELIAYQGNNSGYSEGTTNVNKLLYLSSNRTEVYEGSSYGYATLTLTRSGDWSVSESYTVSSSVANLFCKGSGNNNILPATVTIPKGSTSVSFRIYSVNDDIVRAKEGDITVNAAHGYEGKTIHLNRIDNDRNPLTLTLTQTEITEGDKTTLTITRGGELTDELTLNVACSDVARFDAISAITFAPGESTKTIYISSIDDDAVQLDKSVRFSVSATDYQTANAYLTLKDNDRPTLKLTLSPSVISENAGNAATTAWISRSGGNNTNPMKVRIRTNRSEVFAGSTVVEIPAGESGVEVNLGVTDNTAVDGTRTCNIIAEAFIEADNQYAPSSDKAYSTASLTVVDDESPYLALTSRSASIAEGGSVTVTVTRYVASATGDLVVNLSSAASDVT